MPTSVKHLTKPEKRKPTRVLALDLGHHTGWCVDKKNHGHFDTDGLSIGVELQFFEDKVNDLMVRFWPFDIVAYERPHLRGWAATFSLIGRAAIIEKLMSRRNIKPISVHPSTIKKFITGSGRATKEDVMEAVKDWRPDGPDEADAIALWLYTKSKMEEKK